MLSILTFRYFSVSVWCLAVFSFSKRVSFLFRLLISLKKKRFQLAIIRITIIPIVIILFIRVSSKAMEHWKLSYRNFRCSKRVRETFMFFSFPVFRPFPKGLLSWFQGYQYTSGFRIHQISPKVLPRYSSYPSSEFFTSIRSGSRIVLRKARPVRENLLHWFEATLASLTGGSPVRSSPFRKSRNERTPMGVARILKERNQRINSNPPDPRSKGIQESFRRDSRDRVETPRGKRQERAFSKWDSRRAYREHPYFTANLKFVC